MVLALAVKAFNLTLPWQKILALLLFIPVSNFIAGLSFIKQVPERNVVGVLLAADTAILTAILCQAGGPTNPFTLVYLLHVVLAAVMLTPTWTWTMALLSSLGFVVLFIDSVPVPEWQSHGAHHGFSLHLHGMLFAFILVALLVAHFLNKIINELGEKRLRLERLEALAANQQRLASLTAITAGAAHELATPLSTIAVVSHELEKALKQVNISPVLIEDVGLLKSETARCKSIIQTLSEKTGDLLGETPEHVPIIAIINEAIAPLGSRANLEIIGADNASFKIPRRAMTQTLRAVIKNGLEASAVKGGTVKIEIKSDDKMVIIEVKDRGSGMDEKTLERLGEPFFSTKEHGIGMGLGVYLSRLTLEQLGGKLSYSSKLNVGTEAKIVIPIDCVEQKKAA